MAHEDTKKQASADKLIAFLPLIYLRYFFDIFCLL